MQPFQQWLQIAAATLHLEELEEQRRRRKEERKRREARRRTRRQRTHANGSDSGCSEDQCMASMRSSCMNWRQKIKQIVPNFPRIAADSDGCSTVRVRSQYGLTLSAASAAYVKHKITFKIGLRIAADRSGNPQTHYGYSTHTVRIPSGSRRREHPLRSAASVRRCERGITLRCAMCRANEYTGLKLHFITHECGVVKRSVASVCVIPSYSGSKIWKP